MSEQQLESDYGVAVASGVVRFERRVPGPIERVWTYLTDSELRGKWFGSGPMEPRVGGKVELLIRHADLSPIKEARPAEIPQDEFASTGRVTQYDPPRLLSFLWGEEENPGEVVFELTPQGDEVLLVLIHRQLANRAEMVDVAGGWHTHLSVLVALLYDRTPGSFWGIWRSVQGVYDQRFPRISPSHQRR